MLILLSPAKTLDFSAPAAVATQTEALFLDRSALLIKKLEKFTPRKLSRLMRISPALAELNVARYRSWTSATKSELERAKQALFAFHGDVYEGFDASSLSATQIEFAQSQIRILSGLYGLLRPLDVIEPYRLEMGTALSIGRTRNLYQFWGERVTGELDRLSGSHRAIVNLASQEYFRVVDTTRLAVPIITPVFEERHEDGYRVIGFFAKRARGLMARYVVQKRFTDPRRLQSFCEEGYRFAADASDDFVWRFRREYKEQA